MFWRQNCSDGDIIILINNTHLILKILRKENTTDPKKPTNFELLYCNF